MSDKVLIFGSSSFRYTFYVIHGRPDFPDTVMKSVNVVVQDEKPPKIRCRNFRHFKKNDVYSMSCMVQNVKADDISFLQEAGEGKELVNTFSTRLYPKMTKKSLKKSKIPNFAACQVVSDSKLNLEHDAYTHIA